MFCPLGGPPVGPGLGGVDASSLAGCLLLLLCARDFFCGCAIELPRRLKKSPIGFALATFPATNARIDNMIVNLIIARPMHADNPARSYESRPIFVFTRSFYFLFSLTSSTHEPAALD